MNFSINILVVDDSTTSRRFMCGILESIGFQNMLEAEDGLFALKILSKNKIDLIISDWQMPRMDGMKLLKTIRSSEAYMNIPFLMVTAKTLTKNIKEAKEAGVSDYIFKPFSIDRISMTIENIFNK